MLRPGGTLLADDAAPRPGYAAARSRLSPARFAEHFEPRSDHVRFFSRRTLAALLRRPRLRRRGRPAQRERHDLRRRRPPVRVLLDTTYARRGRSGTGVYLEQLAAALRAAGVDVVEAANERRRAPAGRRGRQRAQPRARRVVDADRAAAPRPRGRRRRAAPPAAGARRARAVPAGRHGPRPRLRAPARALRARLPALGVARAPPRRPRRGRRRLRLADDAPRRARALGPGRRADRRRAARAGPGAARPRAGQPEHFLYVGDDEPRKNLGLLLDAYERYRAVAGAGALALVLAGRARSSAGRACAASPTPDLAALLGAAAALVHPALHEGFGLTALEAMNAGVPGRRGALARARRDVRRGGPLRRSLRRRGPRDGPATRSRPTPPARGPRAPRRARARPRSPGQASARAHIEAYTLAVQ